MGHIELGHPEYGHLGHIELNTIFDTWRSQSNSCAKYLQGIWTAEERMLKHLYCVPSDEAGPSQVPQPSPLPAVIWFTHFNVLPTPKTFELATRPQHLLHRGRNSVWKRSSCSKMVNIWAGNNAAYFANFIFINIFSYPILCTIPPP